MTPRILIERAENGWVVTEGGRVYGAQGKTAEVHGTDERGYWVVTAIFTPSDAWGTAKIE